VNSRLKFWSGSGVKLKVARPLEARPS
jgi:hypothetical protein